MNSKNGDQIVKLNNTNWTSWKYRMGMILIKEDLWETIDEFPPDDADALPIWRKRERKARAIIGLSVEDNQLIYIRNCTTSRDTWSELCKVHEKDSLVSKVLLYKRISQKRLKEGGNLPSYINELVESFELLTNISGDVDNQWKIGMLLGSLPKSII